jgi:hypothetical protein
MCSAVNSANVRLRALSDRERSVIATQNGGSGSRWAALRQGKAELSVKGPDRRCRSFERGHGAALLARRPRIAEDDQTRAKHQPEDHCPDRQPTDVRKDYDWEQGEDDANFCCKSLFGLHTGREVDGLIDRQAKANLYCFGSSQSFLPPHTCRCKWLRKTARRTTETVYSAVGPILDTVSAAECANYFANAGYDQT